MRLMSLVVLVASAAPASSLALSRFRSVHAGPTAQTPGIALNTTLGAVRGYSLQTAAGNAAEVFLGLPYAEPPLGNRRFAPSVPRVKGWDGVLDATTYPPDCWMVRSSPYDGDYEMSEDCLYLNVITSQRCLKSKACPVLFYIYGGGFAFGSPREYHPDIMTDHFVSRDIVFVIPAYRNSILGMWHTDSEDTTGNYANYDATKEMIPDHLSALHWVSKEIRAFGGDAGRVTVMGDSSGAVDASLLTLSPLAKDHFAQAALLSGTAVSRVFTETNDSADIAKALGCGQRNVKRRLICMRELPAENFVKPSDSSASAALSGVGRNPKLSDAFYGGDLDSLIAKRKPRAVMPGLTGTEFTGYIKPAFDMLGFPDEVVQGILGGICLTLAPFMKLKPSRELAAACVGFYATQSPQPSIQVGKAISDVLFNIPAIQDAQQMSSIGGKGFLYSFDHVAAGEDPLAYPGHAEDLNYLMWHHRDYDETDKRVEATYSGVFADFIRFGAIQSPPVDAENPLTYYSISATPGVKTDLHKEAFEFWTKGAAEVVGALMAEEERLSTTSAARRLMSKVDELSSQGSPSRLLKAAQSPSSGGLSNLSPVSVASAGFFTIVGAVLLSTLVLGVLYRVRTYNDGYERLPGSK